MTVEQTAERLSISVEELFKRAYKTYGHIWGLAGPEEGLRIWKRSGIVPMYVLQFIRAKERQIVPLNGHN